MSEADDETIPDSFFDIASGSEASGEESDDDEEADSSSDDNGGNASEVEHDMLESIFGDVRDDGKDTVAVDASDKSEDERKMAATSASGTEKGKNVAPVHTSNKSTKTLSLAPDVREAGRKARLRLEEEKSKRKEIQRIEDDAEGQDLLMQKVPGVAGTSGGAQKKSKSRSTSPSSTRAFPSWTWRGNSRPDSGLFART